jgi:diguanylate cyclase (GGDEF)-like protein
LPLDPLTWLPDRRLFEARLARAIAAARRPFALFLIDLDRIDHVNLTLGRDIGDRVLREAAARMARALRPGATLARLGSDDFAAFMDAGNLADAAKQAGALLEHCREPYVIDCLAVMVTASIGISLYPSHAEDVITLMQRAERALFQAKIRGRDCFDPGGATCSGGTGHPPRTARG